MNSSGTMSVETVVSNKNETDEYEIHFLQNILELLPWCSAPPPLQHPLFHAAHALFLLGYVAPPSRFGMLIMHGTLVAGFLAYSTWAWNIACARDMFSWGFIFALLNLGQTLHVLYQTRPVKTDRELEAAYHTLFKPLNVERLVFKRLVSSECCHVTSLHAGEAYAMQDLTPTDRLGLLLSGKVNVLSGGQLLHSISPLEFLDSPEFESSRAAMDDKFKVSIVASTTSRYLFWRRSALEYQFLKEQHLATALSTLVARDITNKLYAMNSKIVTESGDHLDIRLPSLTSSLNPCLVGLPPPAVELMHGACGVPVDLLVHDNNKLTARRRGADNPGFEGAMGDPSMREMRGGLALGGQYGAPRGYNNNGAEGGQVANGGPGASYNKMEHPLH